MKTLKFSLLAALSVLALFVALVPEVAAGVHAVVHFVGAENLAMAGMLGITVTKSDVFTGKFPTRNFPIHSGVFEVAMPFAMPAAAPGVADLLAIGKIPLGVTVVDWHIQCGDCDSDGSPTIDFTLGTLNAGLTDLATTWKTAVAVAKDASLLRNADNVANAEASTAERIVGIKFTTTATTYVAGKTGLLVLKLLG